jgi:uncharacterized membrane protein (UPF0127 family)
LPFSVSAVTLWWNAVHRVVKAETGDVILDRCEIALGSWQRFRGLMLRRELPDGHGLYFPGVSSIHMCFMRFAIDAAYLDREGRVVKLVEHLKPWRFSACFGAAGILEMPAGLAGRTGLTAGDVLRVEPTGQSD